MSDGNHDSKSGPMNDDDSDGTHSDNGNHCCAVHSIDILAIANCPLLMN